MSRTQPRRPRRSGRTPRNWLPYVPTPQEVVDRMLALAGVGKNDVVLDLGCGDGRIPITAAKAFGAKGIGVDIDPQRIAEANANAKAAGVSHLVTFKLEDAMTTDLSQATVVTLYLLSSSNLKLRPILTRQLKPGVPDRRPQFRHGRLGSGEDRDLPGPRRPDADHLPVDDGREGATVRARGLGLGSWGLGLGA